MRKAKRLSVKSLADAVKQLRAAHGEAERWRETAAGAEAQLKEQASKRFSAEADAKAARAEHDDLKTRLLDAEVECARLRGYMERVREDDAVADPLVEVEDHNGKRMVSKRYLTARFENYGANTALGGGYDEYGRQKEKPKHWVTY